MKMSKREETQGVQLADKKWYCYTKAPVVCRDSKTGRDLHHDRAGKWFLHTPNMTGRPSITPLTINEARQIVQRDGTAEQYLELFFGQRERPLQVYLDGYDLVNLERMAEAAGLSASEFVRRLIRAEYRRQKKSSYDKTRYDKSKLSDMDKPLTADE